MNKELLQERKKMIYDFICDELYVPMKAKEDRQTALNARSLSAHTGILP